MPGGKLRAGRGFLRRERVRSTQVQFLPSAEPGPSAIARTRVPRLMPTMYAHDLGVEAALLPKWQSIACAWSTRAGRRCVSVPAARTRAPAKSARRRAEDRTAGIAHRALTTRKLTNQLVMSRARERALVNPGLIRGLKNLASHRRRGRSSAFAEARRTRRQLWRKSGLDSPVITRQFDTAGLKTRRCTVVSNATKDDAS